MTQLCTRTATKRWGRAHACTTPVGVDVNADLSPIAPASVTTFGSSNAVSDGTQIEPKVDDEWSNIVSSDGDDAAEVMRMVSTCREVSTRVGLDRKKPKKTPQQKALEKLGACQDLEVFTCGCGALSAKQLCELLVRCGIHSVIDVRALPKSKKKPWFNSENLARDMRAVGLMYEFIGKGRKSHTVVAASICKSEQPVCLLGFRASPLECARLVLAEKLRNGLGWKLSHLLPTGDEAACASLVPEKHSTVYDRYAAAIREIRSVQSKCERTLGFSGHWRTRVLGHHRSVHYADWVKQGVSNVDPTVVELPWGSVLMVLPKFVAGPELQALQQSTLPGSVMYEQPLRRRLNAQGIPVSFTQRHRESWLCNGYTYADPKRASPPFCYRAQLLQPWAEKLIESASRAALTPFNGLFSRWEPPGLAADEGPHTFARGSPMLEYTAVAFLSLSGSRVLRVHGLGCWEKLVVDVPMNEGSLVVFGGPLKERWLYWHIGDSESRGERVLLTFLLHADVERERSVEKSDSEQQEVKSKHAKESSCHPGHNAKCHASESSRKSRWGRSVC